MSTVFDGVLDQVSRVSGVRGAMIVDREAGVAVTSELTPGVEPGPAAALASSLFQRAGRAADVAQFGSVQTLQLEAEAGHVIVADAGELLIVVIADRSAQLGLVRLEAHRAAERLQ
jgi:predicted regulator of Ras-like GTPase activity (Roadblock/LC7/MglB family)